MLRLRSKLHGYRGWLGARRLDRLRRRCGGVGSFADFSEKQLRLSAWLDLVSEAANHLQPVTQRLVLQQLGPGPREDQNAIRERLKYRIQPVERAAWASYDQMLRSQGVEEGVQSYSRVIELLIGTNALKLPEPPVQ